MPPTSALPPLADLHRHLDGSLRLSTLKELLAAKGKSVRRDLTFRPGMGLERALERFAQTLAGLQEPPAVKRVAAEMVEDAAREGVTTLEVRFAPQLHRGAPPEAIIDAALEGLAGKAGLILCGLYGEPPAVLEGLVAAAATRPGVVGIDLAGGPSSEHRWILESYRHAFTRAKELGIGRTVHAGEGRAAEEIRMAIEVLGAQRIGHGTTLLEDDDALRLVLERGVTIEVCLTSNLHTDAIPSLKEHPLPEWLKRGVKVAICTDNTLLSDTDAPKEHKRVLDLRGVTRDALERMIAQGHAAAFKRAAP
jgi:adenosine deaminase